MRDQTLEHFVIDNALASREQVRQAMSATGGSSRTWLEQLLLLGNLDEERLCDCVVRGMHVPRCDLDRLANVPRDVLALIPADVAAEHRIVPLWVEEDGDLRVAMADPTDRVGLEEAQFFAGRRLLREVAVPTAIAWALHHYYGAVSVLWPRATRRPLALVVDAAAEEVWLDVDVAVEALPIPIVELPSMLNFRHLAVAR